MVSKKPKLTTAETALASEKTIKPAFHEIVRDFPILTFRPNCVQAFRLNIWNTVEATGTIDRQNLQTIGTIT